MNEIEIEFLEEYKHLEKLLNDIYDVQHGISEYIERLENNKNLGSRIVPGWMDDYYKLKHVRYIRNQITHDSEVSECEEDDVYFVQDFYERVMNQSDPLSLLRKHERKQKEEMMNRQRSQQRIKLEEPEKQFHPLNNKDYIYIGQRVPIEDTPFSEDRYYSRLGQTKNRSFNEHEYKHKEEKTSFGLKLLMGVLLFILLMIVIKLLFYISF